MKRVLPALVLLLAACGGEEHAPDAGHGADGHDMPGDAASHDDHDAGTGGTRPADGVYPFQGKWANPWSDCSLEPGSSTNAPILIEGSTFVGYENECELSDVEALNASDSSFTLTRHCESEGLEYTETVELSVSGDQLTMTTGMGDVIWTRCAIPEE